MLCTACESSLLQFAVRSLRLTHRSSRLYTKHTERTANCGAHKSQAVQSVQLLYEKEDKYDLKFRQSLNSVFQSKSVPFGCFFLFVLFICME